MKQLDIIVGALLIVGGLNWGLVGILDFNLVETVFGEMTALSRLVYTLVGLAAIYDIVTIKSIWKRWNLHYHRTASV